jgi:RNase P/RNase MRP subunit p29
MRLTMAALAALAAIVIPAQARAAGSLQGVVVAKQSQRAVLVLAGRGGAGLTVHATSARAKLGDRLAVRGVRMRDGTVRASRVSVLSHTRRTVIRGVVVRQLRRLTLVATGRSVITIRHAARRLASRADHGDLRAGDIAEFRVRFDDDDLIEEAETPALGQAGNVQIEGRVLSVSPLVVSVEGLPITITVPAGMTLPAALAAGARIELIAQVAAGNVFTLVAIEEIENANQIVREQEIEVKGFVVSSTSTQIVVNSHGMNFTFATPAGVTLPILPTGTFVEVKGRSVNGVLTLERLKLEDGDDDGGGGGGGHH